MSQTGAINDKPCVKCGGRERYEDGMCKKCVNEAFVELRWQGSGESRNSGSLSTARRVLNEGAKDTCSPEELYDILEHFSPIVIEHRGEKNRQLRASYAANPAPRLAYRANRRALKAGAEGSHTAADWLTILDYYDNACLKCGSTENIHKDHIVPLSVGGSNRASNLQPLCKSCNSTKHTRTIDYRPNLVPSQ